MPGVPTQNPEGLYGRPHSPQAHRLLDRAWLDGSRYAECQPRRRECGSIVTPAGLAVQRLLVWGGGMRQQGPECLSEPKGRCWYRCGVVDARTCFSGTAKPRPGVKLWAWRSGGIVGDVPGDGAGGVSCHLAAPPPPARMWQPTLPTPAACGWVDWRNARRRVIIGQSKRQAMRHLLTAAAAIASVVFVVMPPANAFPFKMDVNSIAYWLTV